MVPVPVLLQSVQDVLGVRVHQIRPRLPQRVHNVVDESHLEDKEERETKGLELEEFEENITNGALKLMCLIPTWDFSIEAVCLSHMGLISMPRSLSLSPWWKNSSMMRSVHWR